MHWVHLIYIVHWIHIHVGGVIAPGGLRAGGVIVVRIVAIEVVFIVVGVVALIGIIVGVVVIIVV